MKHLLVPAFIVLAVPLALAKLPAPDDAAKAKAAETAAKAAWQAKVDAFQLCKAQDRVAAQYRKTAATRPAASPGAQAPAASAAPAAAASATITAPAAGTTPTAAAASAPCTEPGPFAYTPPAEKPLEASGAHSPAGTAAGAPSVNVPAAAMQTPPQPAASAAKP